MLGFTSLKQVAIPPTGWIKAIRTTVGMSMQQLGNKRSAFLFPTPLQLLPSLQTLQACPSVQAGFSTLLFFLVNPCFCFLMFANI